MDSVIKHKKRYQLGFTLVELVMVLGIAGVLLATTIVFFKPLRQLAKTSDAKRLSDLKQVQGALDLYYNDMNCYPQTLEFDTEFASGAAVYMQHVPQSDDCASNPAMCYKYQVSGSCPQWYVLYSKLSVVPQNPDAVCPLRSIGNCTPTDYTTSVACFSQGEVSCPTIHASSIGVNPTPTITPPAVTTTPTPTSPPGATPTPTRTPTPTPTTACASKNYSCTTGNHCNVVPEGTGQYCGLTCDGFCN